MKFRMALVVYFLANIVNAEVKYIAVGTTDSVLTSEDGIKWITIDLSSKFKDTNFKSVAYGNNHWVIVSANSHIASSINGIDWTDNSLKTIDSIDFNSVVFYESVKIIV